MQTGFDVFIKNKEFQKSFLKKKLAYLGNPASVSENLENSFQCLKQYTALNWTCIFSPQHGWEGVEQANMIPSEDSFFQKLPVFSLYTDKTRSMTPEHLDYFDVLFVDLQDVGCRVYTFVTTLIYALKSCVEGNKTVVILDRPNPVGRVVEGSLLSPDFESVVGAWTLPIRYGLSLGELAKMYVRLEKLNLNLEVIPMTGYKAEEGWPKDRAWIAPSPNMTDVECARCYSGTVLLEGTSLSEGRGTTSPLKVFGFPKMKTHLILNTMKKIKPSWMEGCRIRTCFFKPVFDKFEGSLCSGLQIHLDSLLNPMSDSLPNSLNDPNRKFKAYRLISLFLKSTLKIHPELDWLKKPPYEYEYKKWPIDILSGDSFLREWIKDPESQPEDLEKKLSSDEKEWKELSSPFHLY